MSLGADKDVWASTAPQTPLCLHFASFSLPVVAKESLDEDAAEAGDEEGRGGEEGEREQGSHHLQSGNS